MLTNTLTYCFNISVCLLNMIFAAYRRTRYFYCNSSTELVVADICIPIKHSLAPLINAENQSSIDYICVTAQLNNSCYCYLSSPDASYKYSDFVAKCPDAIIYIDDCRYYAFNHDDSNELYFDTYR